MSKDFDVERFKMISSLTHTEQGIWWLNGFWADPKHPAEAYAEEVWKFVHLMIKLENGGNEKLYGSKAWKGKETCDIDEFLAHKFLEDLHETMTVMALRKKLKDLDIDSNKRMCLTEYMLAHYGDHSPKDVCEAPQGSADPQLLEAAQAKMTEASAALDKAIDEKEKSDKAAEAAAASAEAAAVAAAVAAADKEKADAAQAELEAAVAELEAQEKAHADKLAALQAIVDDPDMGVVKKNKAKNEIAQMNAEDPLPLRTAKITQGAALKKSEKAAKKAAETKEAADAAKAKADEEKAAADAAAAAAAAAQDAAEASVKEAEAELKKLSSCGVANGKVWWMQREMDEKKKYLPRRK